MATAPVTVNANLNFNPASLNAAGKQVQSAFGNINLPIKNVNAFNNSLGRITGQASEFDKSINAATARVFAFGAAVSIINGISAAFKALISSTIEVEKRLTEINSILGASTEQINQFKSAIFEVAKNTGQTFSTVADGASELARQGLSAEETVKRLNSALILTRVSGLDAEASVSALTAAINGFTSAGLTAEQIVNKLVAVDTAFAVSAKDLAEAFSRAGSTAEDAGVSFDELLGLVTAVQQTTARGGAVIGNALKSIFSRLSRGTVIEDLQALGVEIDASQTGIQKLQALSAALAKISDPTQANAIKELAGGVYQINVVSAALKDLSSETSIFAQASQTAGQASNEAFQKNAQLNQTLAAQLNKLVQGLTELGSKIGELTIAPVIENLLTGANKLLDILNKVFDPEEGNKLIQGFFKGIGAFLAGPGLVLVSAAFFKLFQVVAKFAKEGISDLFKIGSEQERIKKIEGGIVALLQQDANLRAILLSSSTSQAQKEQAVINAIKQQNALLAQQQALVNSIASAAARAGVGGFSPSGGFSKRKGKGMFAAGYAGNVSPEEAMSEMMAANQHGYKAGKVKKGKIFDGTGSSFTGIWNDAENRTDFINSQGYKSTLITPPNGFAASGFVPNFAGRKPPTLQEAKKWVKDVDQISRLSPKQLDDLINNKKFDLLPKDHPSKIAALEKKKTLDKQKEDKLLIKPSHTKPYPFFIPDGGYVGELLSKKAGIGEISGKKYPYELQSKGQIRYRFPTYTPDILERVDDPFDAQLETKITKSIIDAANDYSKILKPPSELKGVKEKITNRIEKQKGAKGAIISAVGSAFEAAITSALDISEAKSDYGADFDVPTGLGNETKAVLSNLFGLKFGWKAAEFKATGSEGNINSYISKVIKVNGLHLNDNERIKKSKRPRRTNAAGFIPNFNSLNKGVPVSQIRAHFDEMGNPVAVTNTRDEPNGLKDAIGREKKGIGAYTENMAARGFIPNFAAGAVIGGTVNVLSKIGPFLARFGDDIIKVGSKSSKATKAIETLGDAAEETAKRTFKQKAGDFVKQEARNQVSGLGSLAIFSMLPSIALNFEDLGNFAKALGDDFTGTSEALKEEEENRKRLTVALEKEKAKETPNESNIKGLEKEISASQKYSDSLANDPDKIYKSTAMAIESVTGLFSFLNGIGVASDKDLENLGPAGEDIASQSRIRKILQPFLTMSGGDFLRDLLYENVGSKFEKDPVGKDLIGEFIKKGLSLPKANEQGERNWSSRTPEKRFLAEAGIVPNRKNLDDFAKAVEARLRNVSPEQQLKLKLEAAQVRKEIERIKKLFEQETVTFKFDVANVRSELERVFDEIGATGAKANIQRAGVVGDLLKDVRGVQNEDRIRKAKTPQEQISSVRQYGAEKTQIDLQQNLREEEYTRQKSADKFGDIFKKITGALNNSSKSFINAAKAREQKASEVAIAEKQLGGLFAGDSSLEDIKAAQDRVNTLKTELEQLDAQKPVVTAATPLISDAKTGFFDPEIGLNAEGEKQRKSLKELETALRDITTSSLGGISQDTTIPTTIEEVGKFQKEQLEKITNQLETLNFGAGEGDSEIKQEILDAAKEIIEERTRVALEEEQIRLTNNLDVLKQEKQILDKFISDFNSSFKQNLTTTRNLFGSVTRNTNPVGPNANLYKPARIGQGESEDPAVIAARLSAASNITSTLDESNLQNLLTEDQLADFKSRTTSQIVSGDKFTALEDTTDIAALKLREKLSATRKEIDPTTGEEIDTGESVFNEQEKRATKQVSKAAFKNPLENVLAEAKKAGDTELAGRAEYALAVNANGSTEDALSAVESLNIDQSLLGEEIQTALQENIARALGAVSGQVSGVEGRGAVEEAGSVNEQIDSFATKLEGITATLTTMGETATKFPEIITTMETNTEAITTALGGLTTSLSDLETRSTGLTTSLEGLKEAVEAAKGSEGKTADINKQSLEAMKQALDAVKTAISNLNATNPAPATQQPPKADAAPKIAGDNRPK